MGTVLKLPSIARLQCSSCGASTDAACNCGVDYVQAGVRAAKAVREKPGMSDRALAAELGVGTMTVSRARKATVPNGTVGSGKATAEIPQLTKRVGKDGKVRRLPLRQEVERDQFNVPLGIKDQPANTRVHGFIYRAREAYHGATVDDLTGLKITKEMRKLAKQAALAWSELAARMTGE